MQLNVPTRFTAITLVKASSRCAESYDPSRPIVRIAMPIPAQLTSTRSGAAVAAASTAASTCSSSVTSART